MASLPNYRVLITGTLHPKALELLGRHPHLKVDYLPDCPRSQIIERVKNAEVLVSRSETDVDREIIDAAPNLKIIARAAVGVSNIDIAYATEKGILICNCPGQNTNSAAELTMGLMLSVYRKIPAAHMTIKGGGWNRHHFSGRELRGKTLGIVGLGNVGHRVAQFARGFDMKVLAYDPYLAPKIFDRHGTTQCSDLAEMVAQCDVLSVHVPLNKETKGMIDADMLAKLPKGAILINAARGGVITEDGLIQMLQNGHLSGAGIDTFEGEPKPRADLLACENVYCTPHIGASTEEAQEAIAESVAKQIISATEGGVVDHPVNLPRVGVIDDPLLRSYAVLGEKLGSIAGQIQSFNPTSITFSYRGDLAILDHGLIKLAWLKGYLSRIVDDYVSFVNVETHVQRLGIELIEKDDPNFSNYKSALKITIQGRNDDQLTIGGTVFDSSHLRFTLINDFYFEIEPEGNLVLIENHDRPGVIGEVGKFLGDHGINIDSFHLSRNRKGGTAMAVAKIDSPLDQAGQAKLKGIRNIIRVHNATI
jgi:D-3-phosphoglycerate dehydrogenase / 2-oxoglutarate reductase